MTRVKKIKSNYKFLRETKCEIRPFNQGTQNPA